MLKLVPQSLVRFHQCFFQVLHRFHERKSSELTRSHQKYGETQATSRFWFHQPPYIPETFFPKSYAGFDHFHPSAVDQDSYLTSRMVDDDPLSTWTANCRTGFYNTNTDLTNCSGSWVGISAWDGWDGRWLRYPLVICCITMENHHL